MPTFQIRDDDFGLALYEAESAREALAAFLADRVKGEIRPLIQGADDGSRATLVHDGERLHAIQATD